MPKTVTVDPETVVDEQPVKTNSRKREFAATAVATTVTVVLGLAATGAINRLGELVKNRIAPEPEKPENELQ
jgi:hypothetical protein